MENKNLSAAEAHAVARESATASGAGARLNPRIILASGSPRRKQLLEGLGLVFEVITSAVEEVNDASSAPDALVTKLANEKAMDVFKKLNAKELSERDIIVLGADTLVYLDGKPLGKPLDAPEAVAMLKQLSGRQHDVYTGVALIFKSLNASTHKLLNSVERSKVQFRKLDEREILAYVETEEPMDKAGAYALQGIGSCLVEGIEGSHTNVVGLPTPNVVKLLREVGQTYLGMP